MAKDFNVFTWGKVVWNPADQKLNMSEFQNTKLMLRDKEAVF